MNDRFIYTDYCSPESALNVLNTNGYPIVQRIDSNKWTINEAMRIITMPELELAVINIIDEISIMEIALLGFMCKPILVTSKAVQEYPTIQSSVNFIDFNCDLYQRDGTYFTSWFKNYKGE